MGTAVEFAELFLKRKVKLNIKVNDKERFYTGFILKIDSDSKSLLFEDKFNKVVAIDLGSILKIEDFVEGVDNGNDKAEVVLSEGSASEASRKFKEGDG